MDSGLPIARIDTQDESYILPVREFLETHGVRTIVNDVAKKHFIYHIVAGDASYVKHIFSRFPKKDIRQMGIILGGGEKEETFSGDIKIVEAKPMPLLPSQVQELFEFFFTEGKSYLKLGSYEETRTIHELTRDDDTRVRSILADVFEEDATPKSRQHKKQKIRRGIRIRATILGMLIGICLFLIPTVWYGLSVAISGGAVFAGSKAMLSGNLDVALRNAQLADYWQHQGSALLNTISVPLSWVGFEDSIRGQQRLLSFINDAATAELKTVQSADVASRVASGLLNQVNVTATGTTAASDISNLRISLRSLEDTLGLSQAELSVLLEDNTFPFSITWFQKRGEGAISDIATIRESTEDIDKLLSVFLALSGFKTQKTYLLLFQNSMELRPTGGFIGSVGVASFEDGRMTNLDIQDVYTFDGQLKGHIDPPPPIADLLGQEHWYLRDSNWDPDFKEAGARAAWFYEKETGTAVDGVFAISTPFMIDLLKATGPIDLADYNDRITADNFYGKSTYYTQNDFFPGSTQKKDFLASLSRALLERVTSDKQGNPVQLFRAITHALKSHDIMMMVADPNIESVIEHYGWGGIVPFSPGCAGVNKTSCLSDPLIVNEANLGTNKVNYFVTRTVSRTVDIDNNGKQKETISVVIHNGSEQKSGSSYQTYVRLGLPESTALQQVSVDNASVSAKLKGNSVLPYVEQSSFASGMQAVGVALVVPAGGEKRLSYTFTQNSPLTFGKNGSLVDFLIQKQPGISDEEVKTTINYPSSWIAGVEADQTVPPLDDFIAKPGQVTYNNILTRDSITRVRFTKP